MEVGIMASEDFCFSGRLFVWQGRLCFLARWPCISWPKALRRAWRGSFMQLKAQKLRITRMRMRLPLMRKPMCWSGPAVLSMMTPAMSMVVTVTNTATASLREK